MPEHPNVLVVLCDELTPGLLGCYGGAVRTPNIDRLAREGAMLTNYTCPLPICGPSRTSIFTGMYPHGHGVLTNIAGPHVKPDDVITERVLHEAGYACRYVGATASLIGKADYLPLLSQDNRPHAVAHEFYSEVRRRPKEQWHDVKWLDAALPIEMSPQVKAATAHVEQHWKDEMYPHLTTTQMGRMDVPVELHYDMLSTSRTCEIIRSLPKDRPFMATCTWIVPHDPFCAPSPYYEMYDPGRLELPGNFGQLEKRFEDNWARRAVVEVGSHGEAVAREYLRIYYANVRLADDMMGQMLAALEHSGRLDDTIVIFSSDHGDMACGHGMITKLSSSFYDELVRVPLLVRYPRAIPAGLRLDVGGGHADLMPTILDLCGQSSPARAQGQSLAPFLTGRASPGERPYSFCEWVQWSHVNRDGREIWYADTPRSFMLRGGGWKYCIFADGDEFLYDLAADPGETANLAAQPQQAPRLAHFRGELESFLARTGYSDKPVEPPT